MYPMSILPVSSCHQDHILTSSYRNGTDFHHVAESGDSYESREIWRNKVQGYMSSPVIVDDHAYLHLGNRRLACLDLRTGVENSNSRPFGNHWSLVAQGNRLLALDSDGEIHLLQTSPTEPQALDSRQASDPSTWSHLAIRSDQLFIRDLEGVTAYRRESPQFDRIADSHDRGHGDMRSPSAAR